MDPSVDKAYSFLRACGFECEREPSWLTEGGKPDFYCVGKETIWVEVKTLNDADLENKRNSLWKELKARESRVSSKGSAYVTDLSEDANEKDINVILKLAEILLNDWAIKKNIWKRAFSLIPFDPIYDNSIRLTFESVEGQVIVLSCESKTGSYELPSWIEPRTFDEMVSFFNKKGEKVGEKPYYELLESGTARICFELFLDKKAFQIRALIGKAGSVRTIERLRDCVKKAASQIKNGQRYKKIPSLVLIYQDSLLVPPDMLIPSVFYGDSTYSFPRGSPEKGDYYYGKNGVFGPSKNRSVSAVSLVRNNTAPYTVHNCWAHFPFPSGLFRGSEVKLIKDRFEIVDY